MKRLIFMVAAMVLLMPVLVQAQAVQNAQRPLRLQLPVGWGTSNASRSRIPPSATEDQGSPGTLTAVAAIVVLLIMLGFNALVLGTLLGMMIWSSRTHTAAVPVVAKKPVVPAVGGLGPAPAVAIAA